MGINIIKKETGVTVKSGTSYRTYPKSSLRVGANGNRFSLFWEKSVLYDLPMTDVTVQEGKTGTPIQMTESNWEDLTDGITGETGGAGGVSAGGLELGVTSTTAFRGDLGNTAYAHSQIIDANPHGVTKVHVGLSSVPNLDTTAAVNNSHTHSNKAILDATTESFTTPLKDAYDTGYMLVLNHSSNGAIHVRTDDRQNWDGKEDPANKGAANGYAPLDASAKVPLAYINDALLGNVKYEGLYDVVTNSPDLTTVSTKGYYYILTTSGNRFGIDFNVGDWIISNGTTWGKVDNTDAVPSVFGRTGNVTAQSGDYDADKITETSGRVFVSPTEKTNITTSIAHVSDNSIHVNSTDKTNISTAYAHTQNSTIHVTQTDKDNLSAAYSHSTSTGNPHGTTKANVGLGNVDNTSDSTKNVLSATKLTTGRNINGVLFDGTTNITIYDATKEPIITTGSINQYYRGDKSWQTLNAGAVGIYKTNGEILYQGATTGLTAIQTFTGITTNNCYPVNLATITPVTTRAPRLLDGSQQTTWKGAQWTSTAGTLTYPGGSATIGAGLIGTRMLENGIDGQLHNYRIDIGWDKASGTNLTIAVILYNPSSNFVRRIAFSTSNNVTINGTTIYINDITADSNSIGNGYILLLHPVFSGGALNSMTVYNIKQTSLFTL